MGFGSWLRSLMHFAPSLRRRLKSERPCTHNESTQNQNTRNRRTQNQTPHSQSTRDNTNSQRRMRYEEHGAYEPDVRRRVSDPPEPVRLSKSPVTTDDLHQILRQLGILLEHIPNRVCGLAAMLYHGFDKRLPTSVSIICPASSRRVITSWARSQGMHIFPEYPDVFGIPLGDGRARRVRVKFLEEGFDDLHYLRAGTLGSYVMSLPGIANQIAYAYVDELKVRRGRRQAAYAHDLLWILSRISQLRERYRSDLGPWLQQHSITQSRAPCLFMLSFWIPFTATYPGSLLQFNKGGVKIDRVTGMPITEGHNTTPDNGGSGRQSNQDSQSETYEPRALSNAQEYGKVDSRGRLARVPGTLPPPVESRAHVDGPRTRHKQHSSAPLYGSDHGDCSSEGTRGTSSKKSSQVGSSESYCDKRDMSSVSMLNTGKLAGNRRRN